MQIIIQGKRYLRAKNAAKLLDVSVSTFWRWVYSGNIGEGIWLSKSIRVWPVEDILRFAKNRAK